MNFNTKKGERVLRCLQLLGKLESIKRFKYWIVPVYNWIHTCVWELSNFVGDMDEKGNFDQHYGDQINCVISSNELFLTFHGPYEENWICNFNSKRHPESSVQSFLNTVTVHGDNQGSITLKAAPQMKTCTKNIATKHHHYRIFVVKGDVYIEHIDTN